MVIIHYKANNRYLVKQDCAMQAIEQGKAVLVERPMKVIRDAGR